MHCFNCIFNHLDTIPCLSYLHGPLLTWLLTWSIDIDVMVTYMVRYLHICKYLVSCFPCYLQHLVHFHDYLHGITYIQVIVKISCRVSV